MPLWSPGAYCLSILYYSAGLRSHSCTESYWVPCHWATHRPSTPGCPARGLANQDIDASRVLKPQTITKLDTTPNTVTVLLAVNHVESYKPQVPPIIFFRDCRLIRQASICPIVLSILLIRSIPQPRPFQYRRKICRAASLDVQPEAFTTQMQTRLWIFDGWIHKSSVLLPLFYP